MPPVAASTILLVLISLISQQLGASLAVTLYPEASAPGVVAMRLTFSAVLLLALTRPRWATVRSLNAAGWRAIIGLGLAMTAMNFLIYEAFARIPQGVAVTLEALGPLTLSILAGRRLLGLLWAGLSLGGIALLSRDGLSAAQGLDPAGVLFALAAGGCWAVFILMNQRAGRHLPGVQGLALAMAFGSVGAIPIGTAAAGSALLEPWVLAAGVGIAVLSSALPYGIEMQALRRIPASLFAILTCLSPVIATLSGLLVLGQSLEGWDVVAMMLVVTACIGAVLGNRPPHVSSS